jgi:hypothetical protein
MALTELKLCVAMWSLTFALYAQKFIFDLFYIFICTTEHPFRQNHSVGPEMAMRFPQHLHASKLITIYWKLVRSGEQWRTQEFFSGVTPGFVSVGGGQQTQLRTEGGENGDPGALAP